MITLGTHQFHNSSVRAGESLNQRQFACLCRTLSEATWMLWLQKENLKTLVMASSSGECMRSLGSTQEHTALTISPTMCPHPTQK